MTDLPEVDDKVRHDEGYEGTVIGVSQQTDEVMVFFPPGAVNTPSGSYPVPAEELEVIEQEAN